MNVRCACISSDRRNFILKASSRFIAKLKLDPRSKSRKWKHKDLLWRVSTTINEIPSSASVQ